MVRNSREHLVELIRSSNYREIYVVYRSLEIAGIPYEIKGVKMREIVSSTFGIPSLLQMIGQEAVLLVPASKLEEAWKVLEDKKEQTLMSEEVEDGDIEYLECSECGCPVDPEDEVCPGCGEKLSD